MNSSIKDTWVVRTALDFGKFLMTGALAGITNIVARFIFDKYMIFELAVLLSYLLGMVIAFTLFKNVNFKNGSVPMGASVFRFCVVNVVGMTISVLVSSFLARYMFPWIGMEYRPYDIAHLFGVACPAVTSYFGHKYYTFRQ